MLRPDLAGGGARSFQEAVDASLGCSQDGHQGRRGLQNQEHLPAAEGRKSAVHVMYGRQGCVIASGCWQDLQSRQQVTPQPASSLSALESIFQA